MSFLYVLKEKTFKRFFIAKYNKHLWGEMLFSFFHTQYNNWAMSGYHITDERH